MRSFSRRITRLGSTIRGRCSLSWSNNSNSRGDNGSSSGAAAAMSLRHPRPRATTRTRSGEELQLRRVPSSCCSSDPSPRHRLQLSNCSPRTKKARGQSRSTSAVGCSNRADRKRTHRVPATGQVVVAPRHAAAAVGQREARSGSPGPEDGAGSTTSDESTFFTEEWEVIETVPASSVPPSALIANRSETPSPEPPLSPPPPQQQQQRSAAAARAAAEVKPPNPAKSWAAELRRRSPERPRTAVPAADPDSTWRRRPRRSPSPEPAAAKHAEVGPERAGVKSVVEPEARQIPGWGAPYRRDQFISASPAKKATAPATAAAAAAAAKPEPKKKRSDEVHDESVSQWIQHRRRRSQPFEATPDIRSMLNSEIQRFRRDDDEPASRAWSTRRSASFDRSGSSSSARGRCLSSPNPTQLDPFARALRAVLYGLL